jgi:murein DD-endopeptidase MepM/ murein hydrolase activator NlpD
LQAKRNTSGQGQGTRIASLAAAAGLLVLLLTFSATAPADPISARIASTRQKIAEARQKEGVLTTTISRYSRRISRLQGEVAGLRNREDRVQRQLDVREAQLRRARTQLRRERVRLRLLRLKLRRSIEVLADRLVAIYKSDDPDIVTVILQSNGFEDLLERSDYLQRIGDHDNQVVARVRTLRNEARVAVSRLGRLERRVHDARDAIAAKRRELYRARSTLEMRQGALSSARGSKQSALAGIREHRHELEGQLRVDEARVQRTLGAAPSPNLNLPAGPIRGGSSGMIWPVNGPVVSGFGMRWGRLHAGIDIASPSGTPIRAARSGIVALASPMSGYGNYVCINHGAGISTCYAHLSSYGTSSGASISQGGIVGAVGCTGHCFGPHLHFEVRVNGSPTDPMGYL